MSSLFSGADRLPSFRLLPPFPAETNYLRGHSGVLELRNVDGSELLVEMKVFAISFRSKRTHLCFLPFWRLRLLQMYKREKELVIMLTTVFSKYGLIALLQDPCGV
jgi:hypothetical protein